jgi:DNA-binding NtrC family response regulator
MTTVLLVDDDPAVVARNVAAISAAGHQVEVATTSAEALASVRRAMPAAVVLEGLLDDGTARFGLARMLSAAHPDLPLIVLTRADDVLTHGERAGQDRDGGWLPVHRFLQKPVMPEVLAHEVEHVIDELSAIRGARMPAFTP